MIIDCISDLHGFYPPMPGGDMLIVAGDLTARDEGFEHREFACWLSRQEYTYAIVVGGNHDGWLEAGNRHDFEHSCKESYRGQIVLPSPQAYYLQDSGIEIEGFKIWGSPWTPTFYDWSFMLDRGEPIKAKWDLIPMDTDILITHGPPWGCLDRCSDHRRAGCEELLKRANEVKPLLHVFGHIHGGYGIHDLRELQKKCGDPISTVMVNAAHCNEAYKPVNKPIRVELEKPK